MFPITLMGLQNRVCRSGLIFGNIFVLSLECLFKKIRTDFRLILSSKPRITSLKKREMLVATSSIIFGGFENITIWQRFNYIPEKRKFSGILCFRQQRSRRRPPPRFVVSAITFEGFKLRSSNLTHALFIQISRTSSITDIVVQSKMAAGGHFVQKFQKKKSCVSI